MEKGRTSKKAGREGPTGMTEGGEGKRMSARLPITEVFTAGKTESHATGLAVEPFHALCPISLVQCFSLARNRAP